MNVEQNKIMLEFIKHELTNTTYGSISKVTGQETELGDLNKWQTVSATKKRRIYPPLTLRPMCRSELYYGNLGLTGEIPTDFHKHFNGLVKILTQWIKKNPHLIAK